MNRRYVIVDVFTRQVFGGNPLAVVLDAEGLSDSQMQSIATEFNYSETTFVCPPRNPKHTAQVRIFTPRIEVPFAGHPNVGTAVVLAQALEAKGSAAVDQFIFEEAAGLVPMRLLRDGGTVVGAELKAPEPLSIRATVSVADVASCVSLSTDDIRITTHPPLDACVEDPATGSATAATISLLASLSAETEGDRSWRVEQGADMGRPSLLLGRTEKRSGLVTAVYVAGHAVPVMQGWISATLPAPACA